MSEKVIKVPPPSSDKKEMATDLSKQESKTISQASERDVQLYYYVLSNTMKNYKMYKGNEHLFRNSRACDNCYQVFNIKEDWYYHTEKIITLCGACYEDNTIKENYLKYNDDIREETGVRF